MYYLRARYYNPATGRFLAEDPIRDGLNWYVYCAVNPIRFIDPSGLAREDTDYTYTTYKTVSEVWGGKVITTSVVDKTYNMTQVRFTNLNMTVYTLDGVNFHSDPAALARGEYLSLNDPSKLITRSTIGWNSNNTYQTLSMVEKMDTAQKRRINRNIITTAVGVAGEGLVGVIINGVVVVVDVSTQTIVGEIQTPVDVWVGMSAVIPGVGTITSYYQFNKSMNYQPEFSPYSPPTPKQEVSGEGAWVSQPTRPRVPGEGAGVSQPVKPRVPGN